MTSSPTSVVVVAVEEENTPSKVEPLSLNWSVLPASLQAQRTCNPIRAIVDPFLASVQEHEKSHISLAVREVKKRRALSVSASKTISHSHTLFSSSVG